MIIGLTGFNAVGKGEVANFFIKHKFKYHSLSDVLRDYARKRGLPETRDNLIPLGNFLRKKYGTSVLARKIRSRLSGRDVVDSIRNPAEIIELRKEKDFFLLGITAPARVRYARSRKRNRLGDPCTFKKFLVKERQENRKDPANQQLKKCLSLADKRVSNNGTCQQLYRKLAKLMLRVSPRFRMKSIR